MIIHFQALPTPNPIEGPVSPLNAIWRGEVKKRIKTPQYGHLMLVFPIGEDAVFCSGITLEGSRYLLLQPTEPNTPITFETLAPNTSPNLLVLWLSPPFIADMARFLNLSGDFQQLLNGVPLLKGDQMSLVVAELAKHCLSPNNQETIEDLFLEVVGEVLRLMRLRQQAVERLASHKPDTVSDLLPRLLKARQFVEARYTENFKTQEVAAAIGLSEFHFSRLFRTAFDTTLRQLVIRKRLDTARHLMEQPQATVTETALEVGYSSLSSFIHAFSNRFGVSPSQYQAMLLNEQDSTSLHPGN